MLMAFALGAGKAFSAGGDLDFLLARTKIDHARNVSTMLEFYSRMLCVTHIKCIVPFGFSDSVFRFPHSDP